MEIEEETEFIGCQRSSPVNNRPRLLYTCGASFLTTAHKAYQRAEQLSSPLGSLSRVLASVASPILHPLEHQWLSILSFIDNQILAVENTTMAIFPPTEHVFNKIDELALLIEGLPKLFDETIDHIPSLVRQLPLLDWVSEKLIMGLRFLVTTVTDWNSSNEKEIMVDIKCHEPVEVPSEEEKNAAVENEEMDIIMPSSTEKKLLALDDEERSRSIEDDIKEVENTCWEVMEALEEMEITEVKATKGGVKKRIVGGDVPVVRPSEHESEAVVENSKDSILELFEEGWLMKPRGGKKTH